MFDDKITSLARAKPTMFSMYDEDKERVRKWAFRRWNGNESLAVRMMIREYDERHDSETADPAPA